MTIKVKTLVFCEKKNYEYGDVHVMIIYIHHTVDLGYPMYMYHVRCQDHLTSRFEGHYANIPMQYTAIFHGCKNDNFRLKFYNFFIFLLKT